MEAILEQIALCVEKGKINQKAPYPPDLKGQEGVEELTPKALEKGIKAEEVLSQALITGMTRIGIKFRENKVFVPDVLMAAKSMNIALNFLKPHFQAGKIQHKGTFIVGTVQGDLHDIGKNLVSMMVEGNGWNVIDLGVDTPTEKFLNSIEQNPESIVGLSALLTTTMMNMEKTVEEIKKKYPQTKVMVGGAPLSEEFAQKIGADAYSPDPQGVIEYLNASVS